MGDDMGLEPVGRPARSLAWVAVWGLGLAAVVAVAVAGPPPADQGTTNPEAAIATASAVAPTSPSARITAGPTGSGGRPFPTRPPLGEDGLVGGLVFGTSWPTR